MAIKGVIGGIVGGTVVGNGESVSLHYDANGRRTEKILTDTSVKYIYSGNILIREQRSDKENMSIFGDDLIAGDSRMVGQVGRYELEYLYGQDGVTAIVQGQRVGIAYELWKIANR